MDNDDSAEEKISTTDNHSVAARQRVREQLNNEVAEFLARGGKIQVLDPTASAANSGESHSYGRQPI